MYSAGLTREAAKFVDLEKLRGWLQTVDYDKIVSLGVYGGEPSINMRGWGEILRMLPTDKPRFVITNGTWSTDAVHTHLFLGWCLMHKLFIVVSGTPEHRAHQDRARLEKLAYGEPDRFRLKPVEENLHPMGRYSNMMPDYKCSEKCVWWDRALRVAVRPDGDIMFQNCDGSYPIVGNIGESFGALDARVQRLRKLGFRSVCKFDGSVAHDWSK